jgi:hypothetical protein
LDSVLADVNAYVTGAISPERRMEFEAQIGELMQPATNPITGLPIPNTGGVPLVIEETLARAGVPLSKFMPRQNMAGGALPQQIEQKTDKGIFDVVAEGLVQGPIPAIGRGLARTPFIGETETLSAPEMIEANRMVSVAKNEVIKVLQNSTHYSSTERQALEEEITKQLNPSAWNTKRAALDDIRGLDAGLIKRFNSAAKTAANPSVSLEEARHARDVLNGIANFREILRAPPEVKTRAEWEAVPAGRWFYDPEEKRYYRKGSNASGDSKPASK